MSLMDVIPGERDVGAGLIIPASPSRPRFPGIVADAKALGIRRETLWRYLNGDWPFPAATKRRYNALKRAQQKGIQ